MSNFHPWQSGTALLVLLSMTVATSVPLVPFAPAFAQTNFSDVPSDYWAKDFITALAEQNIIAGFPDASFKPDAPVTRAQFATMLDKAFSPEPTREAINFVDVPSNYWAHNAIQKAYTTGFISGYPGNVFKPNQRILRVQVLVSLSSGLNYTSNRPVQSVLQSYRDARAIPDYARSPVAAATEKGIVVNYPNVEVLKPNKTATRAEVAAFIYQALVSTGKLSAIYSPYIVGFNGENNPSDRPPIEESRPRLATTVRIPSGTKIPVKYADAERILVAPNEPAPVPLTLAVARNILGTDGTLLIPNGSQVVGELVTIEDEKVAQFVAKQIVLDNGQQVLIRATSQMIRKKTRITKQSGSRTRSIITGSAVGVAAAAAITALTGGITLPALLLGAGTGGTAGLLGLFRHRESVELISITPKTDLTLTLNADLVLPPYLSSQGLGARQ